MHVGELLDCQGNVALVTGAASGIGIAISEGLAEADTHVVLTGHNAGNVHEACTRLQDAGHSAEAMTLDVASHEDVRRAFEVTLARHAHIDAVLANSGISAGSGLLTGNRHIETVRTKDWDRVLRINLSGVFFTVQAAAAPMKRKRRGGIVAPASSAGVGGDGMAGYANAATKAAVINRVRQAAIDLAPDNVLVNGIAPSPFLTNIGGGRMHNQETARLFVGRVPLGRIGQPYEITGAALLLASAASSYMAGGVISIDGGVLSG